MFGFSLPLFAITFFAIAAVAFIIVRVRRVGFSNAARDRILAGNWIDARELAAGIAQGDSKYLAEDEPGCYIILAFDHEVTDGNYANYSKAYAGAAMKAYEAAVSRIANLAAEEPEEADTIANLYFYVQARFYEQSRHFDMEKEICRIMKAKKPEEKKAWN